jgi:threonine/homoserine/homoserine lactone efflux protein
MIDFLIAGIILGLSAGVAPGPLLTLVISETIQHNIKAGVKVALAPLVTDLPIVLLTFFIISKLSSFNLILGIISLCGACFCFTWVMKIFEQRITTLTLRMSLHDR